MTKEHVIKAAVQLIKQTAMDKNLSVNDKGIGHAFDNTFWQGLIEDTSKIPNIIAISKEYKFDEYRGYKIELRSFWGRPEISIRENGDLLVLHYNDGEYDYDKGMLVHTGDFRVHEIRTDGYDYERGVAQIEEIIKFIEEYKDDGEYAD